MDLLATTEWLLWLQAKL